MNVCAKEKSNVWMNSFTFSGKKNPYDAFMLSRVKFNYFQSSLQSKGVFIYNNFCVRFDIQKQFSQIILRPSFVSFRNFEFRQE